MKLCPDFLSHKQRKTLTAEIWLWNWRKANPKTSWHLKITSINLLFCGSQEPRALFTGINGAGSLKNLNVVKQPQDTEPRSHHWTSHPAMQSEAVHWVRESHLAASVINAASQALVAEGWNKDQPVNLQLCFAAQLFPSETTKSLCCLHMPSLFSHSTRHYCQRKEKYIKIIIKWFHTVCNPECNLFTPQSSLCKLAKQKACKSSDYTNANASASRFIPQ